MPILTALLDLGSSKIFQTATLLRVTLFHGSLQCFSSFPNTTKSRKASHIMFPSSIVPKLRFVRFVAVMAIPLKKVLVKIHAQINFLAKWNIQRVIQSEKHALSFNKHHTHSRKAIMKKQLQCFSVYNFLRCGKVVWDKPNQMAGHSHLSSGLYIKKLYCSNKNMEPFTSIPFFWKWK